MKKPTLIKVGKHMISINDVRCISHVKKDLYIVKFYSDPNPTYPCWVDAKNIGALLEHFDIVSSDEE